MDLDIIQASSYSELISLYQDSTNPLVLTPNKRLSRYWRSGLNQCMAQQQAAWPTPRSLSIGSWVAQLWEHLQLTGEPGSLLSATQELILWEQIIDSCTERPDLLNIRATAQLAQGAYRVVKEWQLEIAPETHVDSQLFISWSARFEAFCQRNELVPQVQALDKLVSQLDSIQSELPCTLFFYGFNDISPQLRGFVEKLRELDISMAQLEVAGKPDSISRFEFTDRQTEIKAAADWARHLIIQNPRLNIGIVVPQLSQERHLVERIFNDVFEPQAILPSELQHATGFNLSAGEPLSQLPLVAVALLVLESAIKPQPIEELSKWLMSPYIGCFEEISQRHRIDFVLRKNRLEASVADVKRLASQSAKVSGNAFAPAFSKQLEVFINEAKQLKTLSALPGDWARHFYQLLLSVGWPGSRKLDTLEYQQFQSMCSVLQDFGELNGITGKVKMSEAVSLLRRWLGQSAFQAQTSSSPIQILGMLEAAGLQFDALWVMDMDNETWPPAPNPNPLLPLDLQVKHNVPQSSAQRELQYARQLQQRFEKSTRELVYSHSQVKDDKETLCSPLTVHYPQQEFLFHSRQPDTISLLYSAGELESYIDDQAPAVTDSLERKGGTQLIKDQSACPFRAFARFRLHAETVPEKGFGLEASERGQLIHKALELIWNSLKSQEPLLLMEESELDLLIQKSVDEALLDYQANSNFSLLHLSIEKDRVVALCRQWLAVERQRQFFSVLYQEGKTHLDLNGLELSIRIDRVDQLTTGDLVVIDYKTGKQELKAWAGARPEEPQVPLYCLAFADRVTGAAFAQLHVDEVALKGIAAQAELGPGFKTPDELAKWGLPDSWPRLMDHWRQTLNRIAAEYLEGVAIVEPRIPSRDCMYCEMGPLCRIQQHGKSMENTQ